MPRTLVLVGGALALLAALVWFALPRDDAEETALDLSDDARGEVTVPLSGDVQEAILLVRRLGVEDGWGHDEPLRFSWSARSVAEFPWVLADVGAYGDPVSGDAIAVSWTTEAEHDLVGFNVLRTELPSRRTVRVNPIRIPAMGDRSTESSYRFVDASAEAGASCFYRVEAVTEEGLSTLSDPIPVHRSGPR